MSVGAVNKQTGDRIPTAGMPAIDDALDLTSVNPVQNAVITAALANKQDKTDNNLQTTDKTVVGAINSLKSGLNNLIKSGFISITILANATTGTGYLSAGGIVPRSRIIGIIINKNDDFYYYPVVFSVLENGTIELRMAIETSTTDRTYSLKVVYV